MNEIYLHLYNLLEDDNSLISFPPLFISLKSNTELFEILPFSSYYYESIVLINDNISFSKINNINKCRKYIFKAWKCCNYENYKYLDRSVLELSKIIKAIINNNSYTADFEKINNNKNMINYFYRKWEIDNKELAERIKDDIGCVAIAYPENSFLRNEANSYFSLSGCYKDYENGMKKSKLSNDYNEINKLLKFYFGHYSIESHLTDFTYRYTYFNSKPKGININDCSGRVLKNPITFSADRRKNGHKDNFGLHFSCCEKKIVSAMKYINKDYNNLVSGIKVINKLTPYIFKIQKMPCKMCRPCLIGCYNLYYKYDNYFSLITHGSAKHYIAINSSKKEPLIVL